MSKFLKNNKGASLVYVLITLVFVGAIAMLVLDSARKETIDSSLRASSEMARFAATSGLTYAATLLANPVAQIPEQAINSQLFITNWFNRDRNQPDPTLTTEQQRWIVGSPTTFFTDDNGFRFRVRVMNIDFSRVISITEEIPESGTPPIRQFRNNRNLGDSYITVQLQSEAIDASGSRARNIGIFQIFGYENQIDVDALLTHALHLNGGNIWIHCPVDITGPTFVGARTAVPSMDGNNEIIRNGPAINFMNTIVARSFFRGELIVLQNEFANAILLGNAEFRGPAYFEGGDVDFRNAPSEFHRGFGGSAMFQSVAANAVIMNGTAPNNRNLVVLSGGFTGRLQDWPPPPTVIGNGLRFLGVNTELIHAGAGTFEYYTGTVAGNAPGRVSIIDMEDEEIADTLGIINRNPPAPQIVLTDEILRLAVPVNYTPAAGAPNAGIARVNFVNGALNEAALTDLWNTRTKFVDPSNPARQWLVLSVTGAWPFASAAGAVFNQRAIVIIRNGTTGNAVGNFPNVAGNMLVWIHPDFNGIWSYGGIGGNFRGLFYNASPNAQINLSAAAVGWTVRGAFYNAPQNPNPEAPESNALIQLGTGAAGRITVVHDPVALREFEDLGIVQPAEDDGAEMINLQQIPANLNARGPFTELLNRSF
ncbi:MAG: hypothetical protein FWE23_01155 [Chitinivibrionia bacterium]|nr:hypothetical protein [Chitinivibrionia bacterium]